MSVEVVVTRKSNTVGNFPCIVLQCPVVLTSLEGNVFSTTMSTLKTDTKGRLFIVDVSIYWANDRNRHTKLLHTWKVALVN